MTSVPTIWSWNTSTGEHLPRPVPLDRALMLADQILDALDAAHRRGITHRDLKPANILVGPHGVKVLDDAHARAEKSYGWPPAKRLAADILTRARRGVVFYRARGRLDRKVGGERRHSDFCYKAVVGAPPNRAWNEAAVGKFFESVLPVTSVLPVPSTAILVPVSVPLPPRNVE